MLDDRFKKRYREIPLAIHSILPAKKYSDRTPLTMLHIHEEIEILHITEGQIIVYLDGKEYFAEKGDTLFVSPWTAHRADILAGNFGYICICFNGALLGERNYAKDVTDGKKHLPGIVRDENVTGWVKSIADLYKKNSPGWDYFAQSELLKIFGSLVSENLFDKKALPDNQFSLKIYSIIKERFSEQITSRDCSDSLHIDQSCFCRKFKESFGTTFSNYLCSYRLERARQMLEDKNLSVTEVSDAAGFASTSYFIKKYKQAYGITPKKSMKKEKSL